MTFYVQKSLAHGPIRFGVSPRQPLQSIDSDAGLSTGPSGEFLRRGTSSFFFADTQQVEAPTLPTSRGVGSTPFISSLRPADARGWGFIALMSVGALLGLLGLAVVATKGAQGWIEVILGAALIATPLTLTAQKRRQLRAQEEKERAEREAREKRERETLASYTAALEDLRRTPNEQTLRAIAAARQGLDLPYEIWSPLARRVVLDIGLNTLGSPDVATLMTDAARAAGLSAADDAEVKRDLYRILVWHLLADDRLGQTQGEQLETFRKRFGISDGDLPAEWQACEEFRMLRGITKENLPRKQAPLQLAFREYCIHATRGTLLNEKGAPQGTYSLYVTNKRLIADGKNRVEVPLTQIDDVEVDVDRNVLTITVARPARPLRMQVEQPFLTAALTDLATSIDERPRGFA